VRSNAETPKTEILKSEADPTLSQRKTKWIMSLFLSKETRGVSGYRSSVISYPGKPFGELSILRPDFCMPDLPLPVLVPAGARLMLH
jgi:hypothetical protein